MRLKLLLSAIAMTTATYANALPVSWVDWANDLNCNSSGCTLSGAMQFGTDSVGVTYHSTVNPVFVNSTGGTDYWTDNNAGGSPYTSEGPNGNSNRPTGTDMIALGSAGTHTLTFSDSVSDVYFAFISLNGNNLTFSRPVELLSLAGHTLDGARTDACGYWGCGTATVDAGGNNVRATGGEPHGVALLAGSLSEFSFTNQSEYWHGFTIGAASLAAVAPVPVPAAGLLLLGGLGAIGGLSWRRKRKAAVA